MSSDPILAAFERQCDDDASRSLLETPTRRWSRASIAARCALIRQLLPDSFPAGSLIAVDLPAGPDLLGAYLAIRSIAAVPVLLDHSAPTAEKRRVAQELGTFARLGSDPDLPVDSGELQLEPLDPIHGGRRVPPTTGAVKVTSGSTGAARGVIAPTAALIADEAQLFHSMGLRADDRLLCAIPLTHSYGFSSLVLPALVRGLTLVMPDEPGPLAPLLAAESCAATILPTVPAWIAALLKLSAPPPWPATLRLVVAAGARLPPQVAKEFRARFGRYVHVFYGASECGGISYDRRGDAAERGTVGTLVDGVTVEFDDAGMLAVRSAAVCAGYLPEPSERLAGGRFCTGDLGCWDHDELSLTGRADDIINIKGKKVSPREVETVIAQLPGVDDVAVFAVQTEDGKSLLRAVIAAADNAPTYAQVADWCRQHLAEFKVPRSILVVSELPRTARGKLDRAALST